MTHLPGTAKSTSSTVERPRISSGYSRCPAWRTAAAVPPPTSSMRLALWSIGWKKASLRIASWRRPVPQVRGRDVPDRSARTHRRLATGVPAASRTQPTLCVDDLCTEQRTISVRYVRSEIHPISYAGAHAPAQVVGCGKAIDRMVTALRTDKPLGRTTLAPRRSWSSGARAVPVFYVWTIRFNGTTLIRNTRDQLICSRLKRAN